MQDDFTLDSYDYTLPAENIAQFPAEKRDRSKLLVLDRKTSSIQHLLFNEILQFFKPGDILVVNDTKVFPARLFGNKESGGKAEVFLLGLPIKMSRGNGDGSQTRSSGFALVKSSRKPKIGSSIFISDILRCIIVEHTSDGKVRVELEYPSQYDISEILLLYGSVPLPPYIERKSGTTAQDRSRYQTVYATNTGAVAAPTAGLHFTRPILDALAAKGVETTSLTLHVGFGTFAPVRTDAIKKHSIHQEYISLSQQSAEKINGVKRNGGKVWAVGTTTVRALEFSSDEQGKLRGNEGWCDLYIVPGYTFSVVDNLITNFHLPKSSLLFLVSALCGREKLLECYEEAIAHSYRFYSYGDAMAILS